MPSWFTKAFQQRSDAAVKPASEKTLPKAAEHSAALTSTVPSARSAPGPAQPAPQAPSVKPRKIVHAPVLVDEEEQSGWSKDIRIKARVSKDRRSCVFLVDRPVLEGYSAWFPDAESAKNSPLVEYLFEVPGVLNVTLHDFTVTVTCGPMVPGNWEELAKDIGARIRTHLLNGVPVVSPEFMEKMLPEDIIRQELQAVVDLEINPGIAAHSGLITLKRVAGNTAFITMSGGCQGCAASAITLKEGIYRAFRDAVPCVGAILDETDHDAGVNPFYRQLPEGMNVNA